MKELNTDYKLIYHEGKPKNNDPIKKKTMATMVKYYSKCLY